ncbi:hypothetical protein V8G54_023840 [Vigna mungo]|uniref:Uncharacterized protein n=1 Tax=Vigna mungo TaxID=3915 RepID=A0AAQ3RSL8_VIGMU
MAMLSHSPSSGSRRSFHVIFIVPILAGFKQQLLPSAMLLQPHVRTGTSGSRRIRRRSPPRSLRSPQRIRHLRLLLRIHYAPRQRWRPFLKPSRLAIWRDGSARSNFLGQCLCRRPCHRSFIRYATGIGIVLHFLVLEPNSLTLIP